MMVREFHVSCDECGTEVDGSEWWSSLARQAAKAEGFVVRNGKDLCPECAA